MNDTLINYGSSIKSLDNEHIGGYLVLFSDASSPDLVGDYFTKDTDFGIEDGAKSVVWLHHRKPLKTADGKSVQVKERIGEGTLSIDEKGVLIDAILFNRKQYEEALEAMGWSSGTASHTVDREKKGNASFVKQWLLGLDASITPSPCEPRTSVIALKSVDDEYLSNFIIEGNSIKAVDKEEPVLDEPITLPVGVKFADRLDAALAAAEGVINDAKQISEMRANQKAGRKISQARIGKLKDMRQLLDELITEAEPQPDEPNKSVDQSLILSSLAQFEATKAMRMKRI